MVLSKDQQQLRDFLKETIPFLCKSRLDFRSKFTVEAIIGVTVDESDLFYVSLNEDVSAEVVPKLILERPAGTSQFQKVEGLIDHTLVDVAGDEEYHPKKKKKKTALKRGRKRPGSPLLNMSVDEGDMTSNLDSTEIDLDFIKTEMAEPDFESALDDSFIDKSELDDSALDPLPGTSAGPSLLKDGVEDDGDYSDEGGLDDYSGGDHSDQDGTFDSAKDVEASGSIPAKSDNARCDTCGLHLASKNALLQHKIRRHGEGSGHQCGICDKMFPRLCEVSTHMKIHTNPGKFRCHEPDCDKNYNSRTSLTYHVRDVHLNTIKKFPCSVCRKVFRTKKDLTEHGGKHDVSKRVACPKCAHSYISEGSLKRHMKVCEARNALRLAAQTSSVMCNFCGKTFTKKKNLQQHIKVHKEPSKICESCGKGFKWRTSYRKHYQHCHK